jgi:hypothetical protein
MPDTIPNLWPEEFKIDVQTPYAILRVQASLLSKVTRGLLQGVVETESSKDKMQHRLVVIAPAYKGYRHTLLVAIHNPDLPYPAEVRAQALAEQVKREDSIALPRGYYYETVYPVAHSDDEMQRLVERALKSQQTRAAILSLIAQTNEATVSPAPIPQSATSPADRTGQESRPPGSETSPKPKE